MNGECCIVSARFGLIPGDKAEIRQKMETLMQARLQKQPLEYPSAGSTFKRPTGYYAAALIEQCGLKGLSVGGAQVSTKHCGFIINRDHATFEDVRNLIDEVKKRVLAEKGVHLECEVKILSLTNDSEDGTSWKL